MTFFGSDMCMHAVKAGCAREHWCVLLQVVIPKYLINFFLLFFKGTDAHLCKRQSSLPPRKAVSKSSQLLRAAISLSTSEACLFYTGSCQIEKNIFIKLNINLLQLLFQEISLDLTTETGGM